jgi:lysophospholipase L1-like esterase
MEEWNKAMKAYYYHKKEHFETLPDMKNEIIMLGNSLTDGAEWDELFDNNNIINRGIGGDDTDGILERLSEVTGRKPAKIFLMIGTNDLSAGKSVDYIANNYRKIVERILNESPKTKLYILSELPTDDRIHLTRKNTDLMAINNHLKKIAKEDGLTYIDLFSVFADENNRLKKEYTHDGLHVNGEGYLLWKKTIEKYVQ